MRESSSRSASATQTGLRRPKVDKRIARLLLMIEDSPLMSRQELACIIGISASRLSHLFCGEVGQNITRYRLVHRLAKSATLLARGNVSVKAAAYEAGYRHVSSFSRAFVQFFGQNPSEWIARMANR